jgi:hypothetical protein
MLHRTVVIKAQPAMYARALLTLAMLCASGCKPAPPTPKATVETPKSAYPARPTVAPPAFKVFHQDNDTYTLVTKADATDDEIEAIVWQLRDAAHARTFDALHLSQAFVDARQPIVWFHVYRGAKCAGEKFTKGPLPCEASYHGAGDYTFGSYKNPLTDSGVLHRADGVEVQLWDSEAPYTPTPHS